MTPLSERRLDGITPEQVRSWYAVLATTRSKSITAKSDTRLRQILAQAVDDERMVVLPAPVVADLRHHFERFVGPNPDDCVFTSPSGS